MSDVIVCPARVSGEISPPSSKSHIHRLMIVSALSGNPLHILGDPNGDDIAATARCLTALGTGIERDGNGIQVTPPERFTPGILDAGESGTTLRMLLPVIPAIGTKATFIGRGRLPLRPIGDVIALMRAAGAAADSDALPVTVSGRYKTNVFEVRAPKSSQHISGLLAALAYMGGGEVKVYGALPSAGYADMTVGVLAEYGVRVKKSDNGFVVENGFCLKPREIKAEGDWSGAAFPAALGAVAGSVRIHGLKYPSVQPDSVLVRLLKEAGARVIMDNDVLSVSHEPLGALRFDADMSPDIVPVMAAVAAYAEGETVITGTERLKLKESDRITAVVEMLRSVGVEAGYDGKAIHIRGSLPTGGVVDAKGDHRIAMAAAVLAAGGSGAVTIKGAEYVSKSYEGFFDMLNGIGVKAEWVK